MNEHDEYDDSDDSDDSDEIDGNLCDSLGFDDSVDYADWDDILADD